MTRTRTLQVTTPTDTDIVMSRTFDAPRRLVFAAMTQPELLMRWMIVHDWALTSAEIDLRVGGRYRYVQANSAGQQMAWGGEFREIDPPARLVQTERFDVAWYPGEALITTEFIEEDGSTTVVTTMRLESREARDIALQCPMEEGVTQTYYRLERLLASDDFRAAAGA